ncbi:MAG: ABC transporter permease [Promethearchaeia archaeon]
MFEISKLLKIRKLFKKRVLKDNLSQIYALTEKNVKLSLRFKYQVVFGYISPVVTILLPLIIFEKLFNLTGSLGPWTPTTYAVFLATAYNLNLLKDLIGDFPSQLRREKFWQTLPALIIAPFNRLNLLLGIFCSSLILISVPFIGFLFLNYMVYPVSFWTLLFCLFIYLLIALIFSGIGLFIGVFAITNENLWRFMKFGMNFVFWASCITYPFALFPEIIQLGISLNPLYHIFTFLRFAWIDDNLLLTITTYPHQFWILLGTAILLPLISVTLFNKIYQKHGISGY